MLVNNPMGSRRRRRFYHRAGVVPIPIVHAKDEFIDPSFLLNYEMEPFEYNDEEEFKPTSSFTAGGKRRVNFITITSLHERLLEIMDAMIAMGEAEDREQAKKKGTEEGAAQEVGECSDQNRAKDAGQDTDQKMTQESGQGIEQNLAEDAGQVTDESMAQGAGPSGVKYCNSEDEEE